MKKVCTLMLQRNCPEVSERAAEHIQKWNGDLTDFFVVESGSDDDKIYTGQKGVFHANWPDAKENGLRIPRGFNYGILESYKLDEDYDYYAIMTGDAKLFDESTYEIMLEEMERHPRMGILSPDSPLWGNDIKSPLTNRNLTTHWLVPLVFWMVRKEFIQEIAKTFEKNNNTTYFFDGTNFRGGWTEEEIIMKGYNENWITCVTSRVNVEEDFSITQDNYAAMKTEPMEKARNLGWEEAHTWLKGKYGMTTKQQYRALNLYVYESFLSRNPQYANLSCLRV